jgi:hypothetical protein
LASPRPTRWIVALIGLVVCPVAVLFVLASTCAFY